MLRAIVQLPDTQRSAVLAELAGDDSSTRGETHRKRSQRARRALWDRFAGEAERPHSPGAPEDAPDRIVPDVARRSEWSNVDMTTPPATPVHLVPAFAGAAGSPGVLAGIIGVAGCVMVLGWVLWRFGATLARGSGLASCVLAWLIGMEGGSGYAAFFLVLGVVLWGGGTIAFASRRGYWPSSLTARVFERVLGERSPVRRAAVHGSRTAPQGRGR